MKTLTMAIAVLGVVSMASADSLKNQIAEMNKKVGKTIVKQDYKGFEKIVKAGVTKDFKYIEGGQTMNLDQMLAMVKQSFSPQMKVSKADSKILSFSQKAKSATATVKHTMVGKMMGPDKKWHSMTQEGTSTDTYTMVGKEWKMSSMSWGEMKMTMDGKPFDPSKAGG
ncbi:MAG: hypothetical protein JST12_10410 [Armatimonadetes bacterium]|nr:hypothetical protein [Armatimonadota bacterium]MBS1702063.1 hypothetical protein [Armatimonadota bacterium]